MSTALTESYARGAQTPPLIEQTLGAFFDAMVERFPEREALVVAHQRRRYTYRQLQAEANRLASALLRLGLKPGERVGIWSHNNAEWVLMQLATAKAGLVLVNINPAYRTAEVEYALNKVGCRALVTMPRFKTSDYLGMLRELAPEWAHASPGEPLQSQTLPQLQHADAINIQFTSGTTGNPKGATLTHHNILNNGFFIGEAMKLTEADRLCIPVPLYHCFGMVLGNLAVLTHGGCIVYPGDGFDPLAVLQTVQDERCTGLHGVPTMFIAELDHPRFAASTCPPAHRHHGRQRPARSR
jgi:fatty-acyl-CoA synthase